jgi:tRNA nucleotidyltransferase (CCA-adding enzyme)
MVLDVAARIAPGDALIGWCALTHDLGKALTPAAELPSHRRHEQRGLAPLRALAARLKVPTEYAALAACVCRLHLLAHTAFELRPATVLELFERLDAFRQPRRLPQFLIACAADKRGRTGMADSDYPQARYLTALFHAALEPRAQPLLDAGLRGPELGKALREERRKAIAAAIRAHKKNPAA